MAAFCHIQASNRRSLLLSLLVLLVFYMAFHSFFWIVKHSMDMDKNLPQLSFTQPKVNEHEMITKLIENLTNDKLNMIKRRKSMNSNYHNISQMNDDLFCPANTTDTGHLHLLKEIHRLQYPPDCNPKNRKFYVWEHQCNVGVMANLQCIAFHFAHAIILQRTFIMHGQWVFYDKTECPLNLTLYSSMECFFLPISNCTVEDVLFSNHENVRISYDDATLFQIARPKRHKRMNNTADIIYVHGETFYHQIRGWKAFQTYLKDRYHSELMTCSMFRSILVSYIVRMQPYMRSIVDMIVSDLYYKEGYKVNMYPVVSMIIRWGDKCKQTALIDPVAGSKSEIFCYSYSQFMSVLKELKVLKPNINTVIATCDTEEVITNLTRDYEEWMRANGMKLITNIYDVMPGAKTGLYNHWKVQDNVYKVMISILSTIKLQFGGRYYIISGGSSWGGRILEMARVLKCTPSVAHKGRRDRPKPVHIVLQQHMQNVLHTDITRADWPSLLSKIYWRDYADQNWSSLYNVSNTWKNKPT
eukprot:129704_1